MNLDHLAIFFAVLTLADIGTTSYAIRRLGASEANPVLKVLMDALGRDVALALKLVLAGCVWVFRADIGSTMLIAACVILAAVVLWNLRVISKAT